MFATIAQYKISFLFIAAMLSKSAYRYIFLTDSANDWCRRESAQKHSKAIVDLILGHVDAVSRLVCSTCAHLFRILF